jgi:predicted RNA binding protein YcfA (HicA-like mRNA interferase family)
MKLPVVSGSAAVRAFLKAGYEFDEQHGSHIILRRADRRTDAFPFPTIRNWPKEPCER